MDSHTSMWGLAALAMLVLTVLPFIIGSLVSLFAHRNGEFTFVGLANFDIILAQDWASPPSFILFHALGHHRMDGHNLFFHVSIGLALAMFREPWLKLRGFYRVLLILPWAVPNYITALIWKGMFHRQWRHGTLNLSVSNPSHGSRSSVLLLQPMLSQTHGLDSRYDGCYA